MENAACGRETGEFFSVVRQKRTKRTDGGLRPRAPAPRLRVAAYAAQGGGAVRVGSVAGIFEVWWGWVVCNFEATLGVSC